MCGVFALFLNRPLTGDDIALGRRGVGALGHRGPDGRGEWIDAAAGVYIGHARLAIIDPGPSSDQPVARDGMVLAYNGEIYNFRELREELRPFRSFETRGDVEVLLRAWQTWGEDALSRIDGMFGAVMWNGREAYLAVDPFAEKPLVFASIPSGTVVSSEIAALTRVLSLQPDVSESLWPPYLSLGYFPAPMTAFPAIKRMPPASVVTVTAGKAGPLRRYWKPPVAEPERGPVRPLSESALDDISNALLTSLRRRLITDVPITAFLSAGIDSSLVVALAARELRAAPTCLTISFAGTRLVDEAPAASAIARHLGVPHQVHHVSDVDPAHTTADVLLDLYGEPTENIAVFPLMQVSEVAARHFKVALTGLAGDEMTSGYGKHAHFYEKRAVFRVPAPIRVLLGCLAAPVAPLSGHGAALAHFYGVRDEEIYLAQKNARAIGWLRRVPGFRTWARGTFERGPQPPELAIPAFERDAVMPNVHLISADLGSMHHGLELRTPFLSRDVANTVARFDPRSLVAFGQKSVLRRILARYIPPHLTNLPKSGFSFPVDRFLESFGNDAPSVTGLAPSLVRSAWRRRFDGGGWSRIAIRMAVAARFAARTGQLRSVA